jgi:hypothetical protein
MPKQFAKGIADLGRLQISGCHLVKHWRKESEVIPIDKGNLDIGAVRRGSIEVSRRLYAGESASQNDDVCSSSFLTGFTHHVQEPQVLRYFLLLFLPAFRDFRAIWGAEEFTILSITYWAEADSF